MDDQRRILRDAWITAQGGFIEKIGTGSPPEARRGTQTVDARGGIVLPGLVNTHHHMYQNLARAYPPIANLPLLPWLAALTPLWRTLTADDLHVASLVAMAELMLSGCTTAADHHYVFPRGSSELIDAQFAAADRLGLRFHASRGSMDTASDLIPDWAVQPIDAILNDTERLVSRYHDAAKGGMRRVVVAPCAMTSASPTLYRESAALAARHGLQLHTHCAETIAENDLAAARYGERPLAFLEKIGWVGPRVWFAHGIHWRDEEIAHLGRHRMGVAHCPCSNMRLGSGICRVRNLRAAGAAVGLGVDGSASNDSGHMLGEVRQALLLTRVAHGAEAMTVDDALTLATREGARCLGREHDIGSLEPGKCADLAVFPASDLYSSGAGDAVDGLLLCHPRPVETLIVHGKVRVKEGRLTGLDLRPLLEKHARIAREIVGSAKR
jgi:8-oxoguanine deaminase